MNNLDMFVTNFGSFAYDIMTSNGGLIYPKGTTHTAVFAAGIWVGARVGGQPRVAVAEYGMEYVPGYMVNGTFLPDTPEFRNYTIVRGNTTSPDYLNWPVWQGAPLGPDGTPLLLGDMTTWSVFNDADPALHGAFAGRSAPLGIEVQQTTFAFDRSGPLGHAIFFKFKILNKGENTLEDAHVSIWSDPDLGGFTDDLVGCDTTLALGYAYNATNDDAQYGSTPPAVGFVLLSGPTVPGDPGVQDTLGMSAFTKSINGTDPDGASETYNHMHGRMSDGSPMHVGDDPGGPVTTYAVSGDPVTGTGWLDTNPADRRMLLSAGPFRMLPGDAQEIVAAVVMGHGADRLASIQDLRAKAAGIHMSLGQILTPTPSTPPTTVEVTIRPSIIHLGGHSPYVTAWIESEDFPVQDIDVGSLLLAGSIPAEPKPVTVGDSDGDGRPDLMVKFGQETLRTTLTTGMHAIAVTGATVGGTSFRGTATIRVIDPPIGTGTLPVTRLSPLGAAPVELATSVIGERQEVSVFDTHGRRVGRWEVDPASDGRIVWSGRSSSGARVAPGIYFVRVTAGSREGRVKILLGP